MSTPYVGEIRIFAGNFAPAGWAFCQGQTMPISENEVLFQLIGTTYGGDGEQTFNLPNLASRVPIHMGQGPGISNNYQIGEQAGVESVTLTVQQIPNHTHAFLATTDTASAVNPLNNTLATTNVTKRVYAAGTSPASPMAPQSGLPTGGSQPHTNLQPFLCVNFIISLFGVFPSQT